MVIEHGFRHGIIERREKMAIPHVAKQQLVNNLFFSSKLQINIAFLGGFT